MSKKSESSKFLKGVTSITGIGGITCIIAGAMFKVLHWPGAGALLVLGFLSFIVYNLGTFMHGTPRFLRANIKKSLLIFFSAVLIILLYHITNYFGARLAYFQYLYLTGNLVAAISGLYVLFNHGAPFIALFRIITGLLLSTILVGALFKIMHWPGAGIMMAIGPAGFAISFGLGTFLSEKNKKLIPWLKISWAFFYGLSWLVDFEKINFYLAETVTWFTSMLFLVTMILIALQEFRRK